MSGAKRQTDYFWICERSQQTIENYNDHAKQTAISDAKKMAEVWMAIYTPKKRESIKKRLFRRFFPWKKK